MRILCGTWIVLFVLSGSPVWSAPKLSVAKREMETGDFFSAYRILTKIKNSKPKTFTKKALEPYLETLFVLGSTKKIKRECNSLIASSGSKRGTVAYLCGLHFLESRMPQSADRFFARVPVNEKLFYPTSILRASVDLLLNDPKQAGERLKGKNEKEYEALGLGEVFTITNARVLVAKNEFDKALREYQKLSSTSNYYLQALEETAWVFYKLRRFESSKEIVDIITAQYHGQNSRSATLDVPPSLYYRLRYLRAYIALVQKQGDEAVAEFIDLRKDFDYFFKRTQKQLKPEKALKLLAKNSGAWADIKGLPRFVRDQLQQLENWSGPAAVSKLLNGIKYRMALGHELRRTKNHRGAIQKVWRGYPRLIKKLSQSQWKDLRKTYDLEVSRLAQKINTLSLKAEMGRLEVIWLGRAQGARTVDEIISGYNSQVEFISDYFEK